MKSKVYLKLVELILRHFHDKAPEQTKPNYWIFVVIQVGTDETPTTVRTGLIHASL